MKATDTNRTIFSSQVNVPCRDNAQTQFTLQTEANTPAQTNYSTPSTTLAEPSPLALTSYTTLSTDPAEISLLIHATRDQNLPFRLSR